MESRLFPDCHPTVGDTAKLRMKAKRKNDARNIQMCPSLGKTLAASHLLIKPAPTPAAFVGGILLYLPHPVAKLPQSEVGAGGTCSPERLFVPSVAHCTVNRGAGWACCSPLHIIFMWTKNECLQVFG